MRKYVFIIGAVVSSTAAALAQGSNGYILKGKIDGLAGKVYLVHYSDGEAKKDSVVAKAGVFQFAGSVADPDLYVLEFEESKQRIPFFLENAAIGVSGVKDSLQNVSFTGAPLEKEYKVWGAQWKLITAKAGTLYQKSDAAEKAADSVKKVQLKQEVKVGFESLDNELYTAVDAFVKAHPASPVAAYIVFERFVGYSYPDKAEKAYAQLTAGAKASLYGKQIAKSMADVAKTALGVTPELSMPDTSGKVLKLSDLRGSYVLVDFWASWCGPCRKENPNVVAAYKKFHGKGFDIVGVSLDSKRDAWVKAIEKDGLIWHHVSDLQGWKNAAAVEFAVKSVPTNFLVDKEGKIIGKNLRGEDLEKALEKVL